MKISKIEVQNYRLLKDFSIDLEDELSLIIGKNNSGKTSLLSVMDKFLNSGKTIKIVFNDINIDTKEEIKEIINSNDPLADNYKPIGIIMKLHIDYFGSDDLSNISKLMMDLDPDNNSILLSFEYVLTKDEIYSLRKDYLKFKIIENGKKNYKKPKDLEYFLQQNQSEYFHFYKKTIDVKDNDKFIDLDKENISLKDIINFKFIKANRDVSNKEPDKSLSTLSFKIFEKIETDERHQEKIDKFKDTLYETDLLLGDTYEDIFEETINKVKKFGGMKPDDTKIKIKSTLQHKELLKGNTTVVYEHDNNELPESYNGLGYMNLISMIFEIEILVNQFKRNSTEKPADMNLLFIEEPEAHTHPQMQYVFIKNIKSLLRGCISRKDGEKRELQYIISTHSSHIVAESNFDDIKYLSRDNNSVIAKNLRTLEDEYEKDGGKENYKFLKQYLTLHRAELFFADKAIFIEGDTERILLPAMMKKVDQESPENPMLSQNISIIEVGNYSHIFDKFIDFFNIKSLIITDIDSAKDDRTKCKVDDKEARKTGNSSLQFFYGTDDLKEYKNKNIDALKLVRDATTKKWKNDRDGCLVCIYQTKEKNSDGEEYHARSFEDSFFHLNRQFIIDNKTTFKSLKHIKYFDDSKKKAYELADSCVGKKPALAIEILLNSKSDSTSGKEYINWDTPEYIGKGLLWLKD